MPDDTPFDVLMDRLRQNDPDAQRQVFERFAERLIVLAERRMSSLPRAKIDAEGVAQLVLASFLIKRARGEFDTLVSWDSLWGLLIRKTLWRCGHVHQKGKTQKGDIWKETSPPPVSDESRVVWDPIGREPTPDQIAELKDTVERVMAELDEEGREIFALLQQGYSPQEIGVQLGCTERRARRVRQDIRELLEQWL